MPTDRDRAEYPELGSREGDKLALQWLLNRVIGDPSSTRCGGCGHGGHFHRYPDNGLSPTDPEAKTRCVWPRTVGPNVIGCECEEFVS